MRLLALLLFPGFLWPAELTKSPVKTTDLLKIQRVTEVRMAPDGNAAIFGVQSVHQEKSGDDTKYSYRTNLFVADLNGRVVRQLTFGDRNDTSVAVSPDGKQVAFVRPDMSAKKPQVWVMPLGGPGEALQVTTLENGATGPVWHPNGQSLLVASPIPLSKLDGKPHYDIERPKRDWFDFDREKDAKVDPDGDRRAVRNWLERNASKDNPSIITRLSFQAEQGLQKEPVIPQLFSIELTSRKATQLTRNHYRHAGYAYSPDGASIVYASSPEGSAHPDRVLRNSVWMMNADGTAAGAVLDDSKESYSSPIFSGDGKWLLVEAQQTDEQSFRQSRLARYDVDAKKLEFVGTEWKSAVGQASIATDGSILFTSSWHGGAPLMKISARKLSGIVEGPVGVSVFDEAAGRTVYALISASNPNELFVREKDGSTRQVTTLNSGWLAERQISMPQEKWITRHDGVRVQTWVMNPIGAAEGKKYPFVLDMHGGPSAMWGPGEFSMWHEFQLFCAWGYGVVYSNPRGSSGYGYEFQKGNFKNWGEGPAADVLAALDEAVKTNPLIDTDKLFLTGGSYAGYLTAWIVGHDNRFKAAASQRGVYDLTTFYGEGNAFRLVQNHFGGRPYEPATRRLLDQQSPFTYAAAIRTPLLILHGSEDLRTGVTQSEMLYRALKDQGKAVEYVRYPGTGHELTRSGPPLQRMDHMLRIIEFFERYR